MDVEQSNRLINKFMKLPKQHADPDGKSPLYEHPVTGEYVEAKSIEYDSSWEVLMRVVDEIESLGFYVSINTSSSKIYRYNNWFKERIISFSLSSINKSKFISTYDVIVQFIKWYNNVCKRNKQNYC